MDMIKNDLMKLIGKEFDEDDIICCFTTEDEYNIEEETVIVDKHEGYTSNFEGYGVCELWTAYYDNEDSYGYSIWVDENNVIAHIS